MHMLRFSLKRAASEGGLPEEATPMSLTGSAELPECPEAEHPLREGHSGKQTHRSSLKTALSRKSSVQACGLEVEPLHGRRVSVHFE